MEIYPAKARGSSKKPWLSSFHSFSFDRYYDEKKMGFRSLRVINEDVVAPTKGFFPHHHDNMEILTYVLEGSLKHEDSLGNSSIIHAGEMQRMTAGSGITHSEFNPSATDGVHLYQIWIVPREKNLPPSYEQKFPQISANSWNLVVSPSSEKTLKIHQDVYVSLGSFSANQTTDYTCKASRYAFMQVIKGKLLIGQKTIFTSDGIMLQPNETIEIRFIEDGEILLFDMA